MSGTDKDGVAGQWDPTAGTSAFNSQMFLMRMLMAKNSTATLVKVTSVNIPTQPGATGFVDVQPLINLLDGANNATKHGILHGLPYMRLQGGKNAFIMDPKVGDMGLVVFCDRDISAVVASKAQANPGSRRRFDMADGVYVGGLLCAAPDQYVQFTDTGMKLADKNGNTLVSSSTGWVITGNTKIVGTLETTAAAIFDTTVEVKGAATFDGTIDVKGVATFEALGTFQSAVNITGLVDIGGTLTAAGNVAFGAALNVVSGIGSAGPISAAGNLSGSDLSIPGHVLYSTHSHPFTGVGVGVSSATGTPT